jgi:hypothetical protein
LQLRVLELSFDLELGIWKVEFATSRHIDIAH